MLLPGLVQRVCRCCSINYSDLQLWLQLRNPTVSCHSQVSSPLDGAIARQDTYYIDGLDLQLWQNIDSPYGALPKTYL
jgi:hypothetical protein